MEYPAASKYTSSAQYESSKKTQSYNVPITAPIDFEKPLFNSYLSHPDIALSFAVEEATERYYNQIDDAFSQGRLVMATIALHKIHELEARIPETITSLPSSDINKEEFTYACIALNYSQDDAHEAWNRLDTLSLEGLVNIEFGTRNNNDGTFEVVENKAIKYEDRRSILNLISVKECMKQDLLENPIVMDVHNRKTFSIIKNFSDTFITEPDNS
jgi:hypothetical protein